MNKSNSAKGIVRIAIAIAALATVASSSLPASAAASAHNGATVTLITQNGTNAGAGSPGIFINATNSAGLGLTFVTSVTVAGTCSAHAQTVDTMKSFLSVAQSALLSGKKVNIYYNPCGGLNYIIGIDLLL